METTKMCLLELTKADAMVLANVIRRTANENPFHWKESSVEKTRDLYDNVIAQLYDYNRSTGILRTRERTKDYRSIQ